MKVLLINPPTGLYVREDRCQSSVDDFTISITRPPMDLMMMAASLEKISCVCKIKDYPVEGGDWKVFENAYRDFNPDMLIVNVTTPTLKNDLLSCRLAKAINPKVLTVAKGAHFLTHDREVIKEHKDLDIVIRGENELVVKEIVTNNVRTAINGITYRDNGQIYRNEDRLFLENLDELPVPARHLVRNELYTRPDTAEPMAVIETSRGCPAQCIFCLVGGVSGKKIRYRSVGIIADEIEECLSRYHIHNFHFKSDTFTWNKDWVLGLCREILKRKLKINWICNSRVDTLDEERLLWMKKSGCWAVGLGIESGNQGILDKIKKGITLEQAQKAIDLCRKSKVKSYAYFIIGFPWDTEDTVNDSIEFALKLNPDFIDFFLPYPFPGTEFENIARQLNLLNQANQVRAYSEPTMNTLFLRREELLKLKKRALKRFYLRPGYIFKRLLTSESPAVLRNYLWQGIKTLRKIW